MAMIYVFNLLRDTISTGKLQCTRDDQAGYQWNVAVIHSICGRGQKEDISALIREVKINAEAADAVRKSIPHSKVYYDKKRGKNDKNSKGSG